MGLTGVATDPTKLRRGYAQAAVGSALALAAAAVESGEAELMLYQTGDAYPLYIKLGSVAAPKTLVKDKPLKEQEDERPEWDEFPACPFGDYHLVVHPESALPPEGTVIDTKGQAW